ncbi:Hsp33 family molecular chaperone HslO [Snodgrassella communis]|uniref:Hsp33 family molecular chaperone HslO n=1 Tax=Snodgrassella communis TaxID=2946699 RepID=UPI001EF400DA|nr:Hsp33 family molecular chaperone HslO [Snodgrassella communis]
MTESKMAKADQLTRFMFDDCPVRGLHVNLQQVWQHVAENKAYPKAIHRALGELTVAAVLLASNLKFDGNLIVQVQGKGVLKMLVAEATSAATCRATARWDESAVIDENMKLADLLGEGGMFVLTLQPAQGESWQGVVELAGDSIAQMLMNYMARSEQLATYITLAADDDHASGLLLQRLPEQDIEGDSWTELSALAGTLTEDELLQLDAETLLYRLFHEHEVRLFAPQDVEFACTCSRAKVGDMLLLLGGQEVGEAVVEQGSIEVNCDFCYARYVFDEADVNALFGSDVVTTAQQELADRQINH